MPPADEYERGPDEEQDRARDQVDDPVRSGFGKGHYIGARVIGAANTRIVR